MIGVAAEHTTGKAERVGALEIGSWVDGEAGGRRSGRWMVAAHSFLRWRHERTSEARSDGNRGAGSGRERWSGRRRKDRDGGSESGGRMRVLHFSVDRFCDEFFLVAEQGVLTDGSHAETTESSELGGAGDKGSEIRGRISGIDMESILKLNRKGVEILSDEVQAPDGDFKRQEGDEVRVSGKHFVGVQGDPSTGRGMAGGHGDFLESRDGGLERGSVVAGEGAHIIRAEDRDEKMEFAAIDKFVK